MEKIKILIVDDHKMVRDGIRVMLESNKKYAFIIDEAEDGEEGVEKVKVKDFDLVIMDYQLPGMNGVMATNAIMIYKSETKILALSNYDEYMHISNMITAGTKGFVLKSIGPDELILAIETVLKGKYYYSSDVATKLINFQNDSLHLGAVSKDNKKFGMLSKRQIEILKLIIKEYSTQEIADQLGLTKRTVDAHKYNMIIKLNVKGVAGLIRYAMEYRTT